MHLQKKLKEGKRFYMGDLLKGIATAAAAAVLAFSMTACSQQTLIPETETSAEETVSEAETQELFQAETESAGAEAAGPEAEDLKDVAGLVGMNDEVTADLLGGGEENWTEDSSFYIGRTYNVQLFDVPCQVFTTCGQDNTVESVSVWIVSGERQVTDEEAKEWESRVTEMMGTEPVYDKGISEGGSQNCRWNANGMAATMNRMADILTVSFQPAVGELK